ncbi:hypothetical protein [Halochromatium glycolicum]|uniref:hypothetical protein n=1 Tax=Halochromatium glycolicum TaxID=85075 RepID=UPI00190AAB5F|nr:hypothetical protein [Halochromatium glycolicum]
MQRLLGRGRVVYREGGDSAAQTGIGSALGGQQSTVIHAAAAAALAAIATGAAIGATLHCDSRLVTSRAGGRLPKKCSFSSLLEGARCLQKAQIVCALQQNHRSSFRGAASLD